MTRSVLCAVCCLSCGGALSSGGVGASDAGANPLGFLLFEDQQALPSQSLFYGVFHPDALDAGGGSTIVGDGACAVWTSSADTSNAIGAGALTLMDGTSALGSVLQGTDGTYGQAIASFAKGDVLGVAASGGQAPAFATQTVVAPGPITITSPPAPLVFSRTSDATLAWSGGEPGAQVFFEVPGPGTFALCHFDAALGTGVIPLATLAAILTQPNDVLLWWQERSTTFFAGTYPIQLTARQISGGSLTWE